MFSLLPIMSIVVQMSLCSSMVLTPLFTTMSFLTKEMALVLKLEYFKPQYLAHTPLASQERLYRTNLKHRMPSELGKMVKETTASFTTSVLIPPNISQDPQLVSIGLWH